MTPIAPLNGDITGSWTGAQVTGLHFGSTSVPLSSTAPTSGQVLGWSGTKIVGVANGGAIIIQVNGTTTSASTPINFESGPGITIANPSAGNISISASGVTPQNYWVTGFYPNGTVGFGDNTESVEGITLTYPVSASKITISVQTADTNAGNLYSFGVFNSSGTLLAHVLPTALTTTGDITLSFNEGIVQFAAGQYYFGLTTSATAPAARVYASAAAQTFRSDIDLGATTGGAQPATITPPATVWTTYAGLQATFILHE